jgi:cytochrome c oxidase subunit 2
MNQGDKQGMRAHRRRLLIGVPVALAAGLLGLRAAAQAPRVVAVKVRRFVFTPTVIQLKKGEPVVFELTSEDVLMGFSVPDLNIRSDIVPGKVSRLELPPPQAGTYDFLCDIFCGSGHESMQGKIVVT